MSGSLDHVASAKPEIVLSTEQEMRNRLVKSNYIVIKIGSSAIADAGSGLNFARINALAEAIEYRIRQGTNVIIVSSGAIAAGMPLLELQQRPKDLATKQAAASVGQMALTNAWAQAFAAYGRIIGQILLTTFDFSHREHHTNAARTFHKLRSLGAIAIVNENDTLATDEIHFGDNDRLAALVTHLTGATGLYLLSDIDALYTDNPRHTTAQPIPFIGHPPQVAGITAGTGGSLGTGGMASKLQAALLAADTGIPVLLTHANQALAALRGEPIGTIFAPSPKRLSAKKFWLHSAAEIKGSISIDAGAVQAISRYRKSLLIAGIIQIKGNFFAGEVINILDQSGAVIARGMSNYASADIQQALSSINNSLPKPIVHADDLVVVTIVHAMQDNPIRQL